MISYRLEHVQPVLEQRKTSFPPQFNLYELQLFDVRIIFVDEYPLFFSLQANAWTIGPTIASPIEETITDESDCSAVNINSTFAHQNAQLEKELKDKDVQIRELNDRVLFQRKPLF
jgi:hypothetical protein